MFKPTQYVRQEKAVEAADTNGIRERWFWGLRLLRDRDAISRTGGSLRHGIIEQLIAAEQRAGFKISEREIQWRLQAARTYSTESQIRTVSSDFRTWTELRVAGFPPISKTDGEHPADHRTKAEKDRDTARALVDLVGTQGAMFPLDEFEPTQTTLKEIGDFLDRQDEITSNWIKTGKKRRGYWQQMVDAVDGNLAVTWLEGHRQAFPEEPE